MQVKSVVAGAAIALTAMVSPAVADGETGLKEVQGFSVLSTVSADRLTDQEMSGLRGADFAIVVIGNGVLRVIVPVQGRVTGNMCGAGASLCTVDGGAPVPFF